MEYILVRRSLLACIFLFTVLVSFGATAETLRTFSLQPWSANNRVDVRLFPTVSSITFADGMSREEEAVRKAYAKVTYAVKLKVLLDSSRSTPADSMKVAGEVRSKELRVALSDFSAGNIADIADLSMSELINKPSGGYQLFIGQDTERLVEADGKEFVSVLASEPRWEQEPVAVSDDWRMPIGKALPMIEKQNRSVRLTRYCSYTVSADFAGRSRTYRATAFFGLDREGRETVVPGDLIMNNGGAFSFFLMNPLRPDVLVRSARTSMAIRDWLAAHKSVICQTQSEQVCCDPISLECSTETRGGHE
jgi:hypothetical protein